MSTDVTEEKPEAHRYRFDDFVVDVSDRQLWRGDTRIDLNARYLDALVLLVQERDKLVEKGRFFDEVWRDVVVSDSALTQCIKEIRKQLGDDASNPRYIQTVARHGYRFIGEAEPLAVGSHDSESLHRDHHSGVDLLPVRTVSMAGEQRVGFICRVRIYLALNADSLFGGGMAEGSGPDTANLWLLADALFFNGAFVVFGHVKLRYWNPASHGSLLDYRRNRCAPIDQFDKKAPAMDGQRRTHHHRHIVFE